MAKKKQVLGKGMASLLGGNDSVEETSVAPPIDEILKVKAIEQIKSASDVKVLIEEEKDFNEHFEKFSGTYTVDVSLIKTNPNQPRKTFSQEELKELAQSIQENGIIQPLVVKEIDRGFQLIAGERRLRAAKLAGLSKIPVVVKKIDEKSELFVALVENIQRENLNCIEEALAYYQLMSNFNMSQEQVAKKVGKERSTVANLLRLLKLPRKVIDYLRFSKLSLGHGKILAAVKEESLIGELADYTVENQLSVRELEILSKKKTPFNKKLATENLPIENRELSILKNALESQTGFHFSIKKNDFGKGKFIINFGNSTEFNKIYEFFMNKNHI